MKSGFALVLFAIGVLVCATHAAPFSSEIQEENNQQKVKDLLDLINQGSKSQQEDEDGDEESVLAQEFGRFFSKSSLLNKKRLVKQQNREDNIAKEEEWHGEVEDDLMAAIESLPEEAQAQLIGSLLTTLLPLAGSFLSNIFSKIRNG